VVTISATTADSGGTGSGIILDADGNVLTNMHVVTLGGEAANAIIEVRTSDGHVYPGTVVGTDPLADLAVVKIVAGGLVPAALRDSGKVNVGDTAIAIGAPLGLSGTVTDGIVSAANRAIETALSAAAPSTRSRYSTAAQDSISMNGIQTDAVMARLYEACCPQFRPSPSYTDPAGAGSDGATRAKGLGGCGTSQRTVYPFCTDVKLSQILSGMSGQA
jgi:putative serine protease PepD